MVETVRRHTAVNNRGSAPKKNAATASYDWQTARSPESCKTDEIRCLIDSGSNFFRTHL